MNQARGMLAVAAVAIIGCSPLKGLDLVIPSAGYDLTRDIASDAF